MKRIAITKVTLVALLAWLVVGITSTNATGDITTDDVTKEPQATQHLDTIVLGAGCFWGVEKAYSKLPGVVDAVSGYADGRGVDPTYRAITAKANRMNPDNHAEVVEVTYNSNQTSLTALLRYYFEHHDPTQLNRQGNDIGSQYRSIILTTNDSQRATVMAVLNDY